MAATTTFLLLLLAGIAGTTWFAIAAERSRETAERARETAVAEKERGDKEKMLADQEAVRAGKAEEAAKQAAAMAELETARAKAAETRADEQATRATEANELAQARLARSNYWVALASFRSDRVARGYELLENISERYRNFEWHYDFNRFRESRLSFHLRNGHIGYIALRPDGKRLSASAQGQLCIYNTETGAAIDLAKIERKTIRHTHWSPDGKLFGLLRKDRVDFHDGSTLEFKKSISVEADNFIFAPDGESIYTYRKTEIFRWSYATGEKVWTVKSPKMIVNSIAVSHDGNQVAVGRSNGRIHLYETEKGDLDRPLQSQLGSLLDCL